MGVYVLCVTARVLQRINTWTIRTYLDARSLDLNHTERGEMGLRAKGLIWLIGPGQRSFSLGNENRYFVRFSKKNENKLINQNK